MIPKCCWTSKLCLRQCAEIDDPPCSQIPGGIPRRIVRMTLKQIASLGKELAKFLVLFVGRFRSRPGFALLSVYVQGLLSDVKRKNIEAIALELATAPRTLQRFAESIKWEETGVRDDCQRLVAREHAHPEAIGCIDESGTAKSGSQ